MSDTANTKRNYTLSLGDGIRSMTDHSEAAEPWPGTRRYISYDDCKLRGNIEIDGQKVSETSIGVMVHERLPGRLPLPFVPWKIGELDKEYTFLSLDVSPVVFQQFWDTADERKSGRFSVHVSGQIFPDGQLFVDTVTLDRIWPGTHPIVSELRQQRQQTNAEVTRAIVAALAWFAGVIVVIELIIRWLWR